MTPRIPQFKPDGPEPVKLTELRAKTDHQLQDLVHSKLDVGLSFAIFAEVEQSAGDRAHAERFLERADQSLAEVVELLPALKEQQRRVVDTKLTELRDAVERLGRLRELPKSHTASMF
jgi:hypothetical protein